MLVINTGHLRAITIPECVGVTLFLALIYVAFTLLYNVYFHPLSSYPGPKIAAASRLWYTISLLSGRLPFDIDRLHRKYGSVVRVSPNELVYSNANAWKDIYGHRLGKPEMPKDPAFYASGSSSIIAAPRDRHSYMRRLLSHGFSDKALKSQEDIIQQYVNSFLMRLREKSMGGKEAVDMVRWYNFFTFDVIGDLAFGESFSCLETSAYHPWITLIFDSLKSSSFMRAAKDYPLIEPLLKRFIPKHLTSRRKAHNDMSEAKARRRRDMGSQRPDFLANMVDDVNIGVTEAEFTNTASALVLAGSETTATLLSGATFHLLINPDILAKLVEEVRSSFASDDEIDIVGVNKLTYMGACLDESLRIYPPVPQSFPRTVPEGGSTINGKWVHEKTVVSVTHWAAFHSPENFYLPDNFVPDRWLGDERFKDDDKAALQPFHVGPRSCIGRNLAYVEMRLILASICWNFDMELGDSCDKWDKQEVYGFWQKEPLWVKLKPVVRS